MSEFKKATKLNKHQKYFAMTSMSALLAACGTAATTTPTTTGGLSNVSGDVSIGNDNVVLGAAGGVGIVDLLAGDDIVVGGDKADFIRGGAGVDNIQAGAGIDNIVVIGTSNNGSYTLSDIQNPNGTGIDLSVLIDLDAVNDNAVSDMQAGEVIDGGVDGAHLFVFGEADFTTSTLKNIIRIDVQSKVTLTAAQVKDLIDNGGLKTLLGDGTSIFEITNDGGLLTLDFSKVDMQNVKQIIIGSGVTLELDQDDLSGVQEIEGAGTIKAVSGDLDVSGIELDAAIEVETADAVTTTPTPTPTPPSTPIPTPTPTPTPAANEALTGDVTIGSLVNVGDTLTADTSALADGNGLGAFSYLWKVNGVSVGTSASYTLVTGDAGKAIAVTVSYVDGDGFAESVSSNFNTGLNVITLSAPSANVSKTTNTGADNFTSERDDAIYSTAVNAAGSTIDAAGGEDIVYITTNVVSGLTTVGLSDKAGGNDFNMELTGVETIVFQNTVNGIKLEAHNGENISVEGVGASLDNINAPTSQNGQTITVKSTNSSIASNISLSQHTGLVVNLGAGGDTVYGVQTADAQISTGNGGDFVYIASNSSGNGSANGHTNAAFNAAALRGATLDGGGGDDYLIYFTDRNTDAEATLTLSSHITNFKTFYVSDTNAEFATTFTLGNLGFESILVDSGVQNSVFNIDAGDLGLNGSGKNETVNFTTAGAFSLSASNWENVNLFDGTNNVSMTAARLVSLGDKSGDSFVGGSTANDTITLTSAATINVLGKEEGWGVSAVEYIILEMGGTIETVNTNVLGGKTLTITNNHSNALIFDGSAEMDGKFVIDNSASGATSTLIGGAGKDIITGGSGADTITGGGGKDTVTGGDGADVFDYADTVLAANAMNITEFVTADDTLKFDDASFATSNGSVYVANVASVSATVAGNARYVIVDTEANILGADLSLNFGGGALAYATDTGKLVYDADGDFTDDAAFIGEISTLTGSLTSADFLFV